MSRYAFTFVLILLAAASRLLPHPANFAPITAMALFSAVYLDKRLAFMIPIAAMVVSDYFIGFYSGVAWTYGSFVAISAIGLWLKNHRGVAQTILASLGGSVLFFVVTNFGVWVSSQVSYPHNLAGLVECYVAAIPFFRNTALGDLSYTTALFGIYEIAKRLIPRLEDRPQAIEG